MSKTYYVSKRVEGGDRNYLAYDGQTGWYLTAKFSLARLWDSEDVSLEALRKLVDDLGCHEVFKHNKNELFNALHLCHIVSTNAVVDHVAGEEPDHES